MPARPDTGATRVAIVDADLPNVPDELAASVRAGVEALTGIPAAHGRLSATHTHSGGPASATPGGPSGPISRPTAPHSV